MIIFYYNYILPKSQHNLSLILTITGPADWGLHHTIPICFPSSMTFKLRNAKMCHISARTIIPLLYLLQHTLLLTRFVPIYLTLFATAISLWLINNTLPSSNGAALTTTTTHGHVVTSRREQMTCAMRQISWSISVSIEIWNNIQY